MSRGPHPEETIMKTVSILAVIFILSTPVHSFAGTDAPVTRASVRQELAQLENAGYNPALGDPNYTESLRKAQARIAAEKDHTSQQARSD